MLLGLPSSKRLRHGHQLIKAAASTPAAGSDLGAVEHVVFLMQENRSFDHYYGVLGGVNGFDANSPAFAQAWPGGASSTLLPFHLDTATHMAECTYDLSHLWQAEHASCNDGAMDSFVSTHTSNTYEGDLGTLTMGYYESSDIPFYYELAKNFTICDGYHCSVLGPTHPNRLLQMSGTLDPAGAHGGPILVTNSDNDLEFTCSWPTMPEVLTDAGVSWKVYNPYGFNYVPGDGGISMELCKNVLMYFEQYRQSKNPTLFQNAFGYHGQPVPRSNPGFTSPGGRNDFAHDVHHGQLPAVSWIVAPDGYDEHPPAPASLGEWYTSRVLKTLMSRREVWARTVLFIMYDENDGFFDHVAPPTAPLSTPGEYITAPGAPSYTSGQPIGLGVRVPMLVVSPFSAGGWVCSDTFDHTSQLQFLAERFGVDGTVDSNVSTWRQGKVGNLTSALPTLGTPITKKPKFGRARKTSDNTNAPPIEGECNAGQLIELNSSTPPYPIPHPQSQPKQGPNTLKRT